MSDNENKKKRSILIAAVASGVLFGLLAASVVLGGALGLPGQTPEDAGAPPVTSGDGTENVPEAEAEASKPGATGRTLDSQGQPETAGSDNAPSASGSQPGGSGSGSGSSGSGSGSSSGGSGSSGGGSAPAPAEPEPQSCDPNNAAVWAACTAGYVRPTIEYAGGLTCAPYGSTDDAWRFVWNMRAVGGNYRTIGTASGASSWTGDTVLTGVPRDRLNEIRRVNVRAIVDFGSMNGWPGVIDTVEYWNPLEIRMSDYCR